MELLRFLLANWLAVFCTVLQPIINAYSGKPAWMRFDTNGELIIRGPKWGFDKVDSV